MSRVPLCVSAGTGNNFKRECHGNNVMAQRNYPCDNFIAVYVPALHRALASLAESGQLGQTAIP